MSRRSRVRDAVAAVAVLTVAVGCGQGISDEQASPTPSLVATSTTVVPVEEIAFDADFCAALQGAVDTTAAPPEELSGALDRLVTMLTMLRSTAPPELAGDVRLFADVLERSLPAFQNAGAVPGAGQADADAAQSADSSAVSSEALAANQAMLAPMLGLMATPEMQTALNRVTAYSELRCTAPAS